MGKHGEVWGLGIGTHTSKHTDINWGHGIYNSNYTQGHSPENFNGLYYASHQCYTAPFSKVLRHCDHHTQSQFSSETSSSGLVAATGMFPMVGGAICLQALTRLWRPGSWQTLSCWWVLALQVSLGFNPSPHVALWEPAAPPALWIGHLCAAAPGPSETGSTGCQACSAP